jgi:hypothetical protein
MKEIQQAIRQIAKSNDQVYSLLATVTEVDETTRTCDVEPLNGDAEIFGVRLQSKESDTEGVVFFPEVGSIVIVTFISSETGYVAVNSDIEKVEFKRKTLKIRLDTEGVHLENQSQDLATKIGQLCDLLTDAFTQIEGLKVSTAVGIGLVLPDVTAKAKVNKQKIEQLKTDFSKIFN